MASTESHLRSFNNGVNESLLCQNLIWLRMEIVLNFLKIIVGKHVSHTSPLWKNSTMNKLLFFSTYVAFEEATTEAFAISKIYGSSAALSVPRRRSVSRKSHFERKLERVFFTRGVTPWSAIHELDMRRTYAFLPFLASYSGISHCSGNAITIVPTGKKKSRDEIPWKRWNMHSSTCPAPTNRKTPPAETELYLVKSSHCYRLLHRSSSPEVVPTDWLSHDLRFPVRSFRPFLHYDGRNPNHYCFEIICSKCLTLFFSFFFNLVCFFWFVCVK